MKKLAIFLFLLSPFLTAQVQLGKEVPGGGSSCDCTPAGPAHAVQAANAGVTGPEADQNILLDPVNHQSVITGVGSGLQTITNPFSGYANNWSNTYTTSINAQGDFNRTAYFGGPGGINYGNGPFISGNLWTSSGFNFWNVTFARRGITQFQSGQLDKWAAGDYSWNFSNHTFGVGGLTGASDEGGNGSKIIGGEEPSYYTGTTTTNTAGATTLAISAGQTCDGCFMYDSSGPEPTGHVTGFPATVTFGTTSYFSVPVDTAVTPSTAFAVLPCNFPQLAVQTTPVPVTCVVPLSGISGTSGAFTTGVASLSGNYAEQVSVVVLSTTGGVQTLQITYRNPHASGTSILWQGGPQGQLFNNTFLSTLAGVQYGQTVFGAPDANHLAIGVALGGSEQPPVTNWVAPVPIGAITVSGGVATAAGFNGPQFDNLATAQISGSTGCTGGTLDGTATNITEIEGILSWTTTGSATSCTGANINFAPTTVAYTLYPYAEQIAAGDTSGVAILEPNIVKWKTGDNIVQPHPPTFGYTSRWDDIQIHNPLGYANSVGIFQTYTGAGIGGNFNFIRLRNQNPCSMYNGCGGMLSMLPQIQIEGPNQGTILSTMPVLDGQYAIQFRCETGITCANRDDFLIQSPLFGMFVSHTDFGLNLSGGLTLGGGTSNLNVPSGSAFIGGNITSQHGYIGAATAFVASAPSQAASTPQAGDMFTGVYNFDNADDHCFSAYAFQTPLSPSGGICFGIHAGNVNHVVLQVDNPSSPGSGSTALMTGIWDGFSTPTLNLLTGATIGNKNVCLADGTNCPNAGGFANVTINVNTSPVPAGCTSAVTLTVTGLLPTSGIHLTPQTDFTGVTGWDDPGTGAPPPLYIRAWPTANTLNYRVCNRTSSTESPGASVTWNVDFK